MSKFLRHQSCPACGSSDGCAVYDNDTTYCFACKKAGGKSSKEADDEPRWNLMDMQDIDQLSSTAIAARGLSAEAVSQYGVKVEYDGNGQPCAAYYPLANLSGLIAGYQRKVIRTGPREKTDVSRVGDTKKGSVLPFGAHLFRGGRMVIVCEGAEDAIAAWQMLKEEGKNYRVVSTLGTDGWKSNMDFFAPFEKVVICFDQDAAGNAAAAEFATALRPDQAVIMSWQVDANDPNDLLRKGFKKLFLESLNKARPYEPSGILWGDGVWDKMASYVAPKAVPYPREWEELQRKMGGVREAEISLWTGGSSIGKTSFLRRFKQHLVTETPWKVGEIELEERIEKTCRGMYQFVLGKRWHEATKEERWAAHEATYGSGKLFVVDRALRNKKRDSLMSQFKHLHYSYGCNIIFLDHITLGVREWGNGDGALGDQDAMMEDILGFCEATGCHVALVSHLRKPPGGTKSWSEGAVPSEEDMKGSGSLYQIAFDIIAMSRNKQHQNEYERNVTQLHVTKCREHGDTGPADRLYWDNMSWSFSKAAPPPEEGGDSRDDDRPF